VLLDPLKKTIHADLQGHVHASDLFFSQVLIQVIRLFSQKKNQTMHRLIVQFSIAKEVVEN
jgi:hypothetical protein